MLHKNDADSVAAWVEHTRQQNSTQNLVCYIKYQGDQSHYNLKDYKFLTSHAYCQHCHGDDRTTCYMPTFIRASKIVHHKNNSAKVCQLRQKLGNTDSHITIYCTSFKIKCSLLGFNPEVKSNNKQRLA